MNRINGGNMFELGDKVEVFTKAGDIFHDFEGTIVAIKDGTISVKDDTYTDNVFDVDTDNVFDVDTDQCELILD